MRGAVVPSLVFGELVEGGYELYVKGTDDVRLTVDVARRAGDDELLARVGERRGGAGEDLL